MDTKEMKATLKSARDALKNKEFKEVLKLIKPVLNHDKKNYFALVFAGMATEGLGLDDQVVKAYSKATESDPSLPQAWQGLAEYYEKHQNPENREALSDVYLKLTEIFQNDKEKKINTLLKLAALYQSMGQIEKCVDIYEELINAETDFEKITCYKQETLQIILSSECSSERLELKILELFHCCWKTDEPPKFINEQNLKKFLALLMKLGKYENLMEECHKAQEHCPSAVYPLELSIIHCFDSYTDCSEEYLRDKLTKLLALNEDSLFVVAGQGLLTSFGKCHKQAEQLLRTACETLTDTPGVFLAMANTLLQMRKYKQSEDFINKGLQILRKKNKQLSLKPELLETKFLELEIHAAYRIGSQKSLQHALDLLNEVSSTQAMKNLHGLIYLKIGKLDKAEQFLEENEESPYLKGMIAFSKEEYVKAVGNFTQALESQPSAEAYLMLGKCHWQLLKEKKCKQRAESCYLSFLKAAKNDPYFGMAFKHLGDFYMVIQQEIEKGKKCYQKAFVLEPQNDEIGAAYCDALSESGQVDDAHKILLDVTSESVPGSAKWAWLRLGLYQVKVENPSEAVASFQSALRADPMDSHIWECLAEAYLHRGSLTAALKAFTKAFELNSTSLYSLFQIASIKQTLGMFTEAIADYKNILNISTDYVPALKGIGETLLLLAKQNHQRCLFGLMVDNIQEALLNFTRAVTHRSDFSCLWKLMGDACTLVHSLDPETFSIQVYSRLLPKETQNMADKSSTAVSLLDTLQIGARCYGKALQILPECASLWYDLGSNLFYQSQHTCCSKTKEKCLERCIQSCIKAASLDDKNHMFWNALGRVYSSPDVSQFSKAQHCFIKSIQSQSNVVAWTNLGTLYLKNGNVKLAHEAFTVAQSLEPSYMECWIGQALIAEMVGHHDAMDLFRHTSELGYHPESAMGYANWVCSLLLDRSKHNTDLYQYSIKQMAASPAASDALARYLSCVKNNAAVYNMYGLLLEHQRLYHSAAGAYQRSLALLDGKDVDNIKNTKINLTRVLGNLKRYQEALAFWTDANKLGQPMTAEDHCLKALFLNQSGQWKEAVQEYEVATNKCTSNKEVSEIKACIAMILWKGGANCQLVKEQLMLSARLSPCTVEGLLALAALGVLSRDKDSFEFVLGKLEKEEIPVNMSTDLIQLKACQHILHKKALQDGINHALKSVHSSPHLGGNWLLMSKLLLQNPSTKSINSAALCARAGIQLGSQTKEGMELLALAELMCGEANAVKTAQKLVHLYPNDVRNWSIFLAAGCGAVEQSLEELSPLSGVLTRYMQWLMSPELTENSSIKWLAKQICVHHLSFGNTAETATVLQQIKQSYPEEADWCSLMSDILSEDISSLSQRLMSSNMIDLILMEAVLGICKKFSIDLNINDVFAPGRSYSSYREEVACKALKAYYMFHQLKEEDLTNGSSVDSFADAIMDILNVQHDCSLARVLLGAVYMGSNTRKARYNFMQVLENSSERISCSIARRCLLSLALKDKRENKLIQKIIAEAEYMGDSCTLAFYNKYGPS